MTAPSTNPEFNVLVGAAIRKRRRARGWTQVALASVADISPNYVARLERGELGPSLYVASRLAAALEVQLDTLLEAA